MALLSCHETEPKSNNLNEVLKEQQEPKQVEERKHIFIENDSIFPFELLLEEEITDVTFRNTHFFTIPESAKQLTKIRRIGFQNQAYFPEGIHHFPNLEDIGFIFSRAVMLPRDLNLCKNLFSIGINETRVSSIPSLCNLDKLKYLLITNNRVRNLPEDLGCLQLKNIVLTSNQIKKMPESFFEMSSLKSMTIDTTKIKNISKMKLEKAFPNVAVDFEE